MKRTFIVSVLTVTCTVALVGIATYALLTDSALSSGNQMAAGSMDLLIKNNDTGWLDRLPATKPTWTMTAMYPGQYMDYDYADMQQIDLKNRPGDMAGSTVDIGVINVVVDPPGPASDSEEHTTDMDKMIQIIWMEYENDSLFMVVDRVNPSASLLTDANHNGWLDLDDLENSPVTGLHAPTGSGRMQMQARFRPEADSDYQGDTVVAEFTFTEHQ